MPTPRQTILRVAFALSAGLLASQAQAGSAPSAGAQAAGALSRVGQAAKTGANAGASVGGAMQWMHQLDNLTTVLDHLHKLHKFGPYAQHTSDTPKGSDPPSNGHASIRTCSYPAGYPRVAMPGLSGSMDDTVRIKALIIKEIGSHADVPAAPDLAKWRQDSLQRGLTVEAGPVFGAYLVKLPYAVSERAATGIIRQMYMADMTDNGSTPGCRYDYIEPDVPMKTLEDTKPPVDPVFPPAVRPRIATSDVGSKMLDTDFNQGNKIMGPISEITAHDLWPLLGAWANLPGKDGELPHPLATTAVAVIDPTFYSASPLKTPILVGYHGPITRVTSIGQPGDTKFCQKASQATAGECHGDVVAAVLGQGVRQFVDKNGIMVMGGGSLGRGLFYRGFPDSPPTAAPLYGNDDTFPLERIESGHGLFSVMSALAYAAGRPMGYREVDGHPALTDQLLDATTGKPLPGVKPIEPLSPAPRVVDLSMGDYELAPTPEAAAALCNDPLIQDAVHQLDQKGVIAVAASGNADEDYTDLLFKQQDKGGQIVVVPGDCKGFHEVGGAIPSSNGDQETAVNAPGAIEPGNKDAYWEPFKTHIVTADGPFEAKLQLLPVSGTSIAAPRFAGTIAMMLAIDPDLDPAQVDQLLRSKAITYPGTPDVRMVPPSVVWFKVMRMAIAKDKAKANTATGAAGS